jgi:hypothetical protein
MTHRVLALGSLRCGAHLVPVVTLKVDEWTGVRNAAGEIV